LQDLEQTLTHEKRVQATHVQVVQVQFGEDVCQIRNSRSEYTFEELCHDAALYFNQDPADCVLRDESNALWPAKAKVKDELEITEEGKSVILAPKHSKTAKDRFSKADAMNWQEIAANSKLEMRLRAMKQYNQAKSQKTTHKSRFGSQHGIISGLCAFLLYLAFLVQLIYVMLTE
jgi:UDP-N-acetyl-D-mannosaminuronate dehydrogenase